MYFQNNSFLRRCHIESQNLPFSISSKNLICFERKTNSNLSNLSAKIYEWILTTCFWKTSHFFSWCNSCCWRKRNMNFFATFFRKMKRSTRGKFCCSTCCLLRKREGKVQHFSKILWSVNVYCRFLSIIKNFFVTILTSRNVQIWISPLRGFYLLFHFNL